MSFLQKLPWFAIVLFWLTYTVLGWMVSSMTSSGLIWTMIVLSLSLLIFLCTSPMHFVSRSFASLLKSDLNAFVSVIVLAFVAVLMLCWLEYTTRFLVILAANFLARLELRNLHYSDWWIFRALWGIAVIGFSLGLFSHQLLVMKPIG